MNVLEQIESRGPVPGLALPRDSAARLGRIAAVTALGALIVAAVIIAVDSAAAPSDVVSGSLRQFPGFVAGPLRFLPGSRLTPGTYSELTYAMTLAYLVVLLCSRWIGVRAAVAAVVLLHVVFALTPPLASTDIWNYIGYAHLGALHGLSPYQHVPAAARQDPAFRWVTWPSYKTPYGPLFTVLSYATAPLGVAGGLWVLKVTLAAAGLGCLRLVWLCARSLGLDPVPALLLVGLSPAWLIWTIGGNHNDVLMLIVALGGLAAWLRGRDLAAGVLIVLAAGIKMPAILLLPFLVLRARNPRRMLLGALGGAVGTAVISLVAFGSLEPITAFQSQNNFHSNRSILGQLFRLFNQGHATPDAQWPAAVLLVLAVVALFVWTWRGRANPLVAAGWAIAGLLVSMLWEFPWYVTWLLPLAALVTDRRLKAAALALSVMLLLVYVTPSLVLTS